MHETNPKVDEYIGKSRHWQAEIEKLRAILLDCRLTEELKWGKPCYTIQKRNVAIIIPLKEACALMFCKGALLNDANGILIKPGENTQGGRWIKFNTLQEIIEQEPILRACLQEAVEVENAGMKVNYKNAAEFLIPEELQSRLDDIPDLKTAFYALTPGRQRAYCLYFSAPKQSKTRESRIQRCMRQILDGQGLGDQPRRKPLRSLPV